MEVVVLSEVGAREAARVAAATVVEARVAAKEAEAMVVALVVAEAKAAVAKAVELVEAGAVGSRTGRQWV